MKKAVISTGSKQYVVAVGDVIAVELIKSDKPTVTFQPLLIADGSDVQVGTPILDKASVQAKIVEADKQADKVTAIRYKAKKRVKKVHGHRQHQTHIEITSIA